MSRGNHKILWLVTRAAPRSGEKEGESLTIRIFLTGFQQTDLRALLGELVEIYM
jgi:hypothetical protein